MSDHLPSEIVVEILKRLPVKSLLRFSSVCKSWWFLITSPDFITIHLNQTTSNSTAAAAHTLVRRYCKFRAKEIYSLHLDKESFADERAGIEFPFGEQSRFYFRIVGSCNGILCLYDDLFGNTGNIILWNPMIRRSLTLPVPNFTFDCNDPHMFVLGFGVDPKTNDHKVVRISYLHGDNAYIVLPKVEIFSLQLGSWKEIKTIVPYFITEHFWSQAFINGVVHWVAYYRVGKSGDRNRDRNRIFRCLVMSFDMGSEVFGELSLPECLGAGVPPMNMSASVFGGSLSILRLDQRIWPHSCSIWIMKDYGIVGSWVNQFNIDLEGVLGMALGLRKNGEVLFATTSGELLSYNHGTRTIIRLNMGKCGTKDSFYVDSYIESLVLLRVGNRDLGTEGRRMVESTSSSSGDSEGDDEGADIEVEYNELWMKKVTVQYLTALLGEP
ncbi:hypothetical protein U1Q18_001756 [Sarracenia purpurea var. burkii]